MVTRLTDFIPYDYMDFGEETEPLCGICGKDCPDEDISCGDVICEKCDVYYEYDIDADGYVPRDLNRTENFTPETLIIDSDEPIKIVVKKRKSVKIISVKKNLKTRNHK